MGVKESIKRKYLLKKAIRFQYLIEKLDDYLSKAFNTQFMNFLTLSVFNHRSKQSVLQPKLLKNDKKFRNFAQSVSNFKKLVKISVTTKSENPGSFESFEIGFSYKENEAFVNKQDLDRVVKKFEKLGNEFSIDRSTAFHVGKNFDCLRKEVSNLINLLSEEDCDLEEIEKKLKKVKENKVEIKAYKKMLKSINLKLLEKQLKYKRKYYQNDVKQNQECSNYSTIDQP